MYVDENLQVSDEQGFTSAGLSEKSIDLGASGIDIGPGKQMYFIITIDTSAHADDSSDNVKFKVVTATNEALSGTQTTILETAAYDGSVLTAGRAPIVIPIPFGITQQFIGIYYTLSAGFTSFKMSAVLGFDYQSNLTG